MNIFNFFFHKKQNLSYDYSVEDIVSYTLEKLGGKVSGVKKLMKLLFLIQYDAKDNKIIKYLYQGKSITRAEFYIWSYGPLSDEIYNVIDEKLEIDNSDVPVVLILPDELKGKGENLPETVKKRIDIVVSRYKDKKGYELEKIANCILKLDEYKKNEYMGLSIDKYIEKESMILEKKELSNL